MTHVEIDEVLGLVSDIRSEVTANDAMPSGVVFLIKLFFNVSGNVLLDVELFEGHVRAVNSVLLHLFVHVSVLDHGFLLGCRHSLISN